jgi:hypothetical protein
MAFNWNFKPRTLNGFNSAPVESLMPQAPGAIPTQMKGQGFSPDYNIQGLPQDTEDYQRAAYMDAYEADEAQKAQTLQAQQAGQQKRIADIQNEIATLEKRIAENTAKLQNFSGNADQIAAIEARKINAQDPTSIWRWKVDRDEARRIANAQNKPNDVARANALIEANNILDSMIINDSLDTPTKNAMLSKLADVKTNLEKNGLPTKDVDKKIELLKGNGEQTTREQAKTTWHGLQGKKDLTSAELDAAINDPNINWDPNDLEDAKNLSAKLKKHEAATQSVKDMKADYKRRTGKDFDKADPYIQKKEQERWKRRNKT